MHVFVRLNGDIPLRMRLGVLDYRGHDLFGDAPLGLEEQQALSAYAGGIPLGPFEILLRLDDHLQFVGPFERLVQGRLPALRRETQSKTPLKGCEPDVSRKICNPLSSSVSVSTPSG